MKKIIVQDWIDIKSILKNGIIILKNNSYIKIVKVNPINFSLKSDFEKQSILNSYKVFLKTCNFDIQIIIQSNKENIKKNIENIENNLNQENKEYLNNIGKNYIEFINMMNSFKTSSSKDFYIILSYEKQSAMQSQEIICEELNERFFKVKECLQRCGNSVINVNNKEDVEEILFSFYNARLFLV